MKVCILSTLVAGLSLSFLWHFLNIMLFGTHLIREPAKPVLYSEITFMGSIFVVGIICFVLELKQNRKNRAHKY